MDDTFHDILVQEGELPDLFDLNIESMLAEADQLLRETKHNLVLDVNGLMDMNARESTNIVNRAISANTHNTPNSSIEIVPVIPIVDDDEVIFIGSSKVKASDLPCVDLCAPRQQKRRRDRKLASNLIPCDTIDLDIYQSRSPEEDKPKHNKVSDTSGTSGCGGGGLLKCPVCYDLIKHNAASTICGHVFCEMCIKKSLAIAKKCPLCNKKLTAKNVHPLYLNY